MITKSNALQHMLAHLQAHPGEIFTLHKHLAPRSADLASFCEKHGLLIIEQPEAYTIKTQS